MNIILLGAPGSGKGTQAEKLVNNQHFVQFSTGDVMRKEMKENTPLGQECKKYIDNGQLVPDSIVNAMVDNYLTNEKHDNLIFDGYPRTLDQAKELDKMLAKLDSKIDRVIYIDVAPDIIMERISGRLVCPVCKRSYHTTNRKPKVEGICDYDGAKLVRRSDDEPEKVKTRLKEYEKNTKPLIEYYKNIEKVVKIDGQDPNPEYAYEQILKDLGMNK
ncbi:adenylate kinase [Mesoplasma lactucae]|uniref:Adenylate kinase n=1 Tax=Mesoplasma lactucae ATCC 49193 TaxID=81460 RepID=A0A291IQX0_9MOLU|nr:adenylate kinase [Mesoplasma lactucae]ATG97189.1 adenylate kinase [Mesoplasma lactucae ATCC 49193]ATZ20370.1 adenylate kinase [Mesoplasma lactucae ATCC 49193]MCL8216541.1 adenylate kinase [Mesoplasma lactucae ATCC 49193]